MNERLFRILLESFPKILLPGLTMTIPLTVISFSLALVIAVVTAIVQFANVKVLKQIARFYIWVVRGTPLLVQLYVIFYGLPNLGIMLKPFPSAVLVFSINEGAYCAETIRAALESVPKGQLEAGYCVGMSYMQIMRATVGDDTLCTRYTSSMVKARFWAVAVRPTVRANAVISVFFMPICISLDAKIAKIC